MKTLGNTDQNTAKSNVSDMVTFGADVFKLISKASSQNEGWMKSTKAMEIEKVGCVVQVTTQQLNDTGNQRSKSEASLKHSVIAEALTFVPCVKIQTIMDSDGDVMARILVNFKAKSEVVIKNVDISEKEEE